MPTRRFNDGKAQGVDYATILTWGLLWDPTRRHRKPDNADPDKYSEDDQNSYCCLGLFFFCHLNRARRESKLGANLAGEVSRRSEELGSVEGRGAREATSYA